MVQVKIPTPLRKYTGGAGGVEADGLAAIEFGAEAVFRALQRVG